MLPDVYLFNPTCEYAVANGTVSWQPNRLLQQMEAGLGTLPLFFACQNDYVLVKRLPSKSFIQSLKQIGITPPVFLQLGQALSDNDFLRSPKRRLLPWGWSPATHHLLNPLKNSCSAEFLSSPVSTWKPAYKELYSKIKAAEVLSRLLSILPEEFMLPRQYTPEKCFDLAKVELLLTKWGKIMVKAPWSSAGRGLQPVTCSPLHPSVSNRIRGLIREQGAVVVEPLFDKVFDFAFQFSIQQGEITYLGTDLFQTDEKGRYKGNYLNNFPYDTDSLISGLIDEAIKSVPPGLKTALKSNSFAANYEGFLGVDAMIYRDNKKQLRIHPCLEINLRYNMGLLAFKLNNFIAPEKKGMFKTYYRPNKSFKQFSDIMMQEYPLNISNHKIKKGYFPITDVSPEALFGAFILVE
ncbi:hypothetical protein MNBD_BACTEROID01-698 [hydrothermal vent metagenome]|uniref:ATP-grasp domain-containing protein n=1 Tax=hydrothermal vent metagenome TaxID=652676 RepID=A0A3B0TMY1_9ZZZZ